MSVLGFTVASVNLPPSQVGAAQLGARPRRRVGSSGARLSNMSEAWYLWGVRFRVQRSAFRVQDLGFSVQGAECRVQGAGFRVQNTGIRA